jgi:hypothetical protein
MPNIKYLCMIINIYGRQRLDMIIKIRKEQKKNIRIHIKQITLSVETISIFSEKRIQSLIK